MGLNRNKKRRTPRFLQSDVACGCSYQRHLVLEWFSACARNEVTPIPS